MKRFIIPAAGMAALTSVAIIVFGLIRKKEHCDSMGRN